MPWMLVRTKSPGSSIERSTWDSAARLRTWVGRTSSKRAPIAVASAMSTRARRVAPGAPGAVESPPSRSARLSRRARIGQLVDDDQGHVGPVSADQADQVRADEARSAREDPGLRGVRRVVLRSGLRRSHGYRTGLLSIQGERGARGPVGGRLPANPQGSNRSRRFPTESTAHSMGRRRLCIGRRTAGVEASVAGTLNSAPDRVDRLCGGVQFPRDGAGAGGAAPRAREPEQARTAPHAREADVEEDRT